MFEVPEEEVQSYISIPTEFTNGVKKDAAIFIADGSNHFTHYGIYEGMFLIFDLGAQYMSGHLSAS